MGQVNDAYIDKNLSKAVLLLHKVIAKAPNAPTPFNMLGMIYEETKEYSKALNAYMLAAYLTPKDLELWIRLVYMGKDYNNHHLVIFACDRILRSGNTPDFNQYRIFRSESLIALKRYDKALHQLDSWYDFEPYNLHVMRLIGLVYEKKIN